MTTNEEIRMLQSELDEIEKQIEPLENRSLEIKQKILELKSQFKVGDVIEWKCGDSTRKGRVESIKEWLFGEPEWRVINIKKDGSLGARFTVSNYSKPTLSKP